MRPKPLYQRLATLVQARHTCLQNGNTEWFHRHEKRAVELIKQHMPQHGSGFDTGTHLDWGKSTSEKLVFTTSFHHMDSNGCYDGWTDHVVTIKPSLQFGFDLKVSGRDRNDIKDYTAEMFDSALRTLVTDDLPQRMAEQDRQENSAVANHIDGYDRDDLGESPDH